MKEEKCLIFRLEESQNPKNPCDTSISWGGETHKRSLSGFTLAEVLITLSILGVVAAITVPSIIRHYQEKATVVKLKRVYSQLQQAFDMAWVQYGDPSSWKNYVCGSTPKMPFLDYNTNSDTCTGGVNVYYAVIHASFLPVGEPKCIGGYQGFVNAPKDNCYISADESVKYLNGNIPEHSRPYENQLTGRGRVLLKNGALISYPHFYDCTNDNDTCAWINVDIDGKKGPNTWGKDIFQFNLTKKGIVPLSGNCNNSNSLGLGCADYIIKNGNMDYLRKK